jgi:flotillin
MFNSPDISYLTITVIGFLLFIFSTIFFLAKLYRRCPSNKILVVYGRVAGSKTVQCYHGGGTFIWPLIQGYSFLDLTPRTIHIPLKGALSHQNIRVNVPSTFTVAVGVTPDVMNNAAVRILDLDHKEIESMATEIIIGQLRLTVASLRIEEINQDRERFLEAIKNNIEPELHKIGLTLINVNITDITDESEYISSIGMKASSMAVNQAKIDVAEQEKQGEIGRTQADMERRIKVATYHAEAVLGENEAQGNMASAAALLAKKQAEADRQSQIARQSAEIDIQKAKAVAMNQAKIDMAEQERLGEIGKALADKERRIKVASYHAEANVGEYEAQGNIALSGALLAEKQAEADKRSQIAKQLAELEIQKAKAAAKAQELEAQEIVPQEIKRRKMQIEADAEAQRNILIAKGEAAAILAIKEAEAEGIQKLLNAKAKGYKQLLEACGEDAKSAATMLLVEKLEEIVKLQVEAIKNIKIDKITVWDSGNTENGKGSSTSNFISQFTKSLPALHDIASLAGLELPEYLGKVSKDSQNGINQQ